MLEDKRVFRVFSENEWVVRAMNEIKASDLLIAEDIPDTYYICVCGVVDDFEPGDSIRIIVDIAEKPVVEFTWSKS